MSQKRPKIFIDHSKTARYSPNCPQQFQQRHFSSNVHARSSRLYFQKGFRAHGSHREAPLSGTVEVFFESQKHCSTSDGLCAERDGLWFGVDGFFSGSDGTFSRPAKMNSRPHRPLSRLETVCSGSVGLYSGVDGLLSTRNKTLSASDKTFSARAKPYPARTRFYPGGIKAHSARIKVNPSWKSRKPGGEKSIPCGLMLVQPGKALVQAGQGLLRGGQMSVGATKGAKPCAPSLMRRGLLGRLPESQSTTSRKVGPALFPHHRRGSHALGGHFSPINQQKPKTNNKHVESTGYLGWDGRSGQSIDLGYAWPFLGWPRS